MIRFLKIVVFLACLVPLGLLLWGFFGATPFDMTTWGAGLGANPIERITHATGDWTLRFLLITLSITPLRKLLNVPSLIRFRRMLGLFAFFYGSLHLMTYVWLDKFFAVREMLADIAKRPFITMGLTAFVLMIPLAITSTKAMVRRLGYKKWEFIHRAIYVTAILAVIHYLWLVKSDKTRPLRYGAVVAVLLLWRVGTWLRDRKKRQAQRTHLPREARSRVETAS